MARRPEHVAHMAGQLGLGLFFIVIIVWCVVAAGCCPKPPPAPVLDFCSHPGVTCTPYEQAPPEVQAELSEQAWCCDYEMDPPCWPVDFLSLCLPSQVAIYCEHGRSTPAGPNGFECYS